MTTVIDDHNAFLNHPRSAEIASNVEDFLRLFVALNHEDRSGPIHSYVSSIPHVDAAAYRGAVRLLFRREAAGEGADAISNCRVLDDLLRVLQLVDEPSQYNNIIRLTQGSTTDDKILLGSLGMIFMGLASLRELGAKDVNITKLIEDIDSLLRAFLAAQNQTPDSGEK
jgi:hypothetical protein